MRFLRYPTIQAGLDAVASSQIDAFGLPQGSKLREGINESLLRRIDGQPWNALVKQTLGADE